VVAVFLPGCTKDEKEKSLTVDQLTAAGIDEIFPANSAEIDAVNPVVGVTFKAGTDPSRVSASSLSLKKGNISVAGKVTVSGLAVLFTYSDKLTPHVEYTATVQTKGESGSKGEESVEYSWKFKTGEKHRDNSLSVVSVEPVKLAAAVPVSTSLIITVNQEVKTWMKNLISVVLKKGSTLAEGSISFKDNKVTFKPSVNLTPGTIYTANFAYGTKESDNDDDKENDGDNALKASSYYCI
jgi:hypothetical protein